MSTSTELFSGIGERSSSKVGASLILRGPNYIPHRKVLAPPGGKSNIGFGDDDKVAAAVPKNVAAAAKARDLSSNPLAAAVSSLPAAVTTPEEPRVGEAPRPRGAPNRAKAPPGGHSQGFW
jgi:hypothetical protein